MNVMLIGEKGVGKSSLVIDSFNKNKLKWVYFSGATLDPWTDLVGIPKPKVLENGNSIIEYIRPETMSDDVEAIFCDEFNRMHKKCKNALLELIQFKSINGRKFPKLRIIWAAINPDDEESSYDVEPVDPAQLDRFHVIVNLPYKPDRNYFIEKYNKVLGNQAINWWEHQPDLIKKAISPRRLDYALDAFRQGVDIADVLPRTSNLSKLKEMLNMCPTEVEFNNAYAAGDTSRLSELLNNDSTFQEIKRMILNDENYFINISSLMHLEKVSAIFTAYPKFSDWVRTHPTIGNNKKILDEKFITFKQQTNTHEDIERILGVNTGEIEVDPKVKLLSCCSAFLSLTKKLTTRECEKNFKEKFYPYWTEYFYNQRHTTKGISKQELVTVTDYLAKIQSSIHATQLTQFKVVIKNVINLFTVISFPLVFMDEDKISDVFKHLNVRMNAVFKNAFNLNPEECTLGGIASI